VRVLAHIKKLDDCFGQFLVRVSCACGASCHIEPDALVLSQAAFYSRARGVLKVLDHMIAQGDYDGLHKAIERQGRQIKVTQARRPRARRH
jgi:hypothetical protein